MKTDLWHEKTLQRLTTMLRRDPDVLTLAVFGSYLQPVLLDIWSDLDLLLVVKDEALERFFPALDWLMLLGTPYAYEQSSTPFRHTTYQICPELANWLQARLQGINDRP